VVTKQNNGSHGVKENHSQNIFSKVVKRNSRDVSAHLESMCRKRLYDMSSPFASMNPLFVNLLTSYNSGFAGVTLKLHCDDCGIANVVLAKCDPSTETSCSTRAKSSCFVIKELEALLLVREPSFAEGGMSELEGPLFSVNTSCFFPVKIGYLCLIMESPGEEQQCHGLPCCR
jgi:hypothetical protein